MKGEDYCKSHLGQKVINTEEVAELVEIIVEEAAGEIIVEEAAEEIIVEEVAEEIIAEEVAEEIIVGEVAEEIIVEEAAELIENEKKITENNIANTIIDMSPNHASITEPPPTLDSITSTNGVEDKVYTTSDTPISPKLNNCSLFESIFDIKKGGIRTKNLRSLGSNEFVETFDRNKLAFILNNIDAVKAKYRPNARDGLSIDTYYFGSRPTTGGDGEISVQYIQNHEKKLRGRYQAFKSISGQAMVREVRQTIFDGKYIDLDMDNCHPVIQVWLCRNLDIPCKFLKQYVDHREEIIRDLITLNPELTREDFKKLFLSINYGNINNYKAIESKSAFLKSYYEESGSIKAALCDKFTVFRDETREIRNKQNKRYNYLGAAVSHICAFVENQLLMIISDHLRSKIGDRYYGSILCFDGIMVPQDCFSDLYIPELEAIFNMMDIPMKLSVKPFKPLDLEGELGYDTQVKYAYVDPLTVRSTCKTVPPICDAQANNSFIDYLELQKTPQTYVSMSIFITSNIAFISDGGQSVYLTKNFSSADKNGNKNIQYKTIALSEAKGAFSLMFDIIREEKPKSLMSLISRFQRSITYSHRDFIPFGARAEPWDYSSLTFNSFSGFVHPYESNFQIDYSLIAGFLGHIENIWANGDKDVAICILKLFASILQNPSKKTGVCLVVTGPEGFGKNIVTDMLRDFVIGLKYVLETPSMHAITKRFNGCLENKLLTILNEAANLSDSSHGDQDILKDLITEDRRLIEPKGRAPYTIRDCNNYICFSNNEYVIRASTEMRRFVFLRGSDSRVGDKKYFQNIADDFEKRGAGIHLYHYLMNLDISDFKPQRDFPITEMKKELQADAICKTAQYLIQSLDPAGSQILLSSLDSDDGFISSANLFGLFSGTKDTMLTKNDFEAMMRAGKPLADATIMNRAYYIAQLYKKIGNNARDLSFLGNAKAVIKETNSSKSMDVRKTRLFHVLSMLELPAGKIVPVAIKKSYRDMANKLRDQARIDSLNNVMPEKAQGNLLSISEANTRLEGSLIKLYENYNLSRNVKMSGEDFGRLSAQSDRKNIKTFARDLQRHMIVACYVWQPSLRSDWGTLEISSAAANRLDAKKNWLQVLRSGRIRIIMNNYKNAKSMGQQIIEIDSQKLKQYLKYWIDLMSRIMGSKIKYLFMYELTAQNEPKINSVRGTLTKAISRSSEQILQQKMSVNDFRHAWEMSIQNTQEYQQATQLERTEMHRQLLHGLAMGQQYNWMSRNNTGDMDGNAET
ncbi:hypothetical protein BBJ28_00015588 [Nothophytophthora sp. Chile5]|nr:hypothetical protein BBJ28_00015588 [Nothophytophthora sp. Chile5]